MEQYSYTARHMATLNRSGKVRPEQMSKHEKRLAWLLGFVVFVLPGLLNWLLQIMFGFDLYGTTP